MRAQLAPKVLNFLQAAPRLDLGRWRRACLGTAARAALLASCDIGEAIAAIFRMRGFEDLTEEQRKDVIRESPEDLDLIRFAVSDAHFRLRQQLGLALRKQ